MFQVVAADGDFEVRKYAPSFVAETVVEREWNAAGLAAASRQQGRHDGCVVAFTMPSEYILDRHRSLQPALDSLVPPP